jgi:2-polyprenyl-3-methyl-5-hydroxy-6-metoxy-1,4-benzoquinol methylase
MKKVLRKLAKSLLFKILPYRPIEVTREDWDAQYTSQSWDHLKQLSELARYSVIVGYSHYFKQAGSILDIGCGEGVLQEKLRPHKYARYVGIDISPEAIWSASIKQEARTFFCCADAKTYNPDNRFDIIIFNECLYYFKNPLYVVRTYERFLKENGLIIVSMYVGDRTKKIWGILENFFTIEDSTLITNRSGTSWRIACWKMGCVGTRPVTAREELVK